MWNVYNVSMTIISLHIVYNAACHLHTLTVISGMSMFSFVYFLTLLSFNIFLQGFKYLYLTPQDYKKVSALNSVHCEHVEDEGESRYVSISNIRYMRKSLYHSSVILLFCEMTAGCQAELRLFEGHIWFWVHIYKCVYMCVSCHTGTRLLTSLERMKGWVWKIWKGLEWLLESHLWLMRRSSPWTWWDWSGKQVISEKQGLIYSGLSGLIGHLQSYRDWGLSGEAWTENYSSGQFSHYPHWCWSSQQGNHKTVFCDCVHCSYPTTLNVECHTSAGIFFVTGNCLCIYWEKEKKLEKCSKNLELFQLNGQTAFFIVRFY